MFRAEIITVSDKCYKKEKVDKSGIKLEEILVKKNYQIEEYIILPNDKNVIRQKLEYAADTLEVDIIFTIGGTGFHEKDITPEATMAVIDRQAMGIAEAIRAYSMTITKKAMLSRAVSGIRKKSLIINLPGSAKAVVECLEFALPYITYVINILRGNISNYKRN
ncbi:MAG: MogA/MoaB family molybdenum cofactor biosynthesis protein [Bacteroidetes bacterium]|nr:MogA/MoaB family molybdenum cofactor biosynthesis protein [Bacteroidota bacterium]